ncbi:RES family NAD+ phosphorylase [Microbulbifer yueqingensis]|uniref:RES domain-containing protein n=1 Tax=Microbulbifer yueqingensis TaxID=658219 RepID=A0A1G9AA72_9GAMM|nr:RES family NAD+ phosphorylase [Microbulbifer yueqingensis]SDK24262.1 RES domain-containing protein [Microbulbifer yueqingensis]
MTGGIQELIDTTSQRIMGRLFRIVESQEDVATRSLVDSVQKQEALENLLERSKPRRLPGSEHLHYLLATPFRYPPLPWGSRFGSVAENGIFYGSKTITTVLAESAYYRLVFLRDMVQSPADPITSYHTIFSARYCLDPGVRLQEPAWEAYWDRLSDPARYQPCQQMAKSLRGAGVAGIETPSARARQAATGPFPPTDDEGINVALFSPGALFRRTPAHEAEVIAETGPEGVAFLLKLGDRSETRSFPVAPFLVEGEIPRPA